MVAATSGLCRTAMHGAAKAFGRARVIGAAKSVSLKKISRTVTISGAFDPLVLPC